MAANCGNERSFEVITERCLAYYNAPAGRKPLEIISEVMDDVNFPMHNFAHHYLVPAVLLTAVCVKEGTPPEIYQKRMAEIAARAKNVLPAFCGLYGACGAAVGCGIFMSVQTGTTPLSKETWGLCNHATAGALEKMADMGGPRCCKRNTFAALAYMRGYLAEKLSIDLEIPNEIKCTYSKFNNECLKEDCPYYDDKKKETK